MSNITSALTCENLGIIPSLGLLTSSFNSELIKGG